jgi:GNAT superfamily N-acetyltransferase
LIHLLTEERPVLHSKPPHQLVGTADAYKRQGVATKLVHAAEDWGREHGAVVAVCDTFIESPLSVPFWEPRMGYKRRSIIFRKRLD